jgi:hypothetical protein
MEQLYNPVEAKDAKFGERIKASHIQFAHGCNFYNETTNKASFAGTAANKDGAVEAAETKADLRKAHFAFGSDYTGKAAFTTTNQERSIAPGY